MAANTNSSTQPDPETFGDSRRRRDNQLADTSTRREITVRAVWPGDFPPTLVRSPPRPANTAEGLPAGQTTIATGEVS